MSSKVFEHAGYLGSIEVSIEDECFFGKILFIDDLVTYESDSFAGLKQAFQEAVDHYLERCHEAGVAPDKPCSGTFNVRVSQELHRASQREAARRGIGLNDFVKSAIEHELEGGRVLEIHNHEHTHTYVGSAQMVSTTQHTIARKWTHEKTQTAMH